jgi:hypothetical protein
MRTRQHQSGGHPALALTRTRTPSPLRLMFRSPIGAWLIGCDAIPEQHRVLAAATTIGWQERRA